MKSQVLPRIKVCGLTRAQDAELAVSLGAWALGFIFHEESPRAISPENVAEITQRTQQVKRVGVFVNSSLAQITEAVERSGVDTVQLHGDESPEFCKTLKGKLTQTSVIKALRPRTLDDLRNLGEYSAVCEAVLLDAYVPGSPGGTGVTGDWALAADAAKKFRIILAGGLNPANIQTALRVPGLFAVDVSSGLEEGPGRKSSEKMRSFFMSAATLERPA